MNLVIQRRKHFFIHKIVVFEDTKITDRENESKNLFFHSLIFHTSTIDVTDDLFDLASKFPSTVVYLN